MAVDMSPASRDLLILYASQTGTATDVAERLGRKARARFFSVRVQDMGDYKVTDLIKESLVIFVVATAGQGDAPDSMVDFWQFLLRKQLSADALAHLNFTVFGLGDSSYTKYNYPAKRLHKRLLQLGAQQFYKRGLGDDQHLLGLDGELTPWQVGLWQKLLFLHPLPEGEKVADTALTRPLPKYRVAVMSKGTSDSTGNQPTNSSTPAQTPQSGPFSSTNPLSAQVKCNERMTTEDHWQDVRHIVLDVADPDGAADKPFLQYTPGDVCAVLPSNPPELVDWFLGYLNLDGQSEFILTAGDPKDVHLNFPPVHRLPDGVNVRNLLTHYLDLHARPRGRYFFELLAHFAQSDREVERLRQLSMPENLDELYDYCYRVKRTPQEVFIDFPSLKGSVPLSYMFDLFPMIQPRQFSIASSPRAHPNEIHLCVAIVKYQTRITEPRYGQCTHMLARTTVGQRLPIWIMKGTIFMPKREDLPMLMIGPGTGVAPFRGFIGERLGRAPSDDATDGRQGGTASAHKSMLVFGNRKQEKDYLFGREWEAYRKSNQLDLVTAFSRDQPDKVYVQHEMINRGKDIWDLIHNGKAVVYVCGNSKRMPDDVKKALRTIAQTHAPMTEDEASSYITQLETARRLQLETWA